MPGKRKATPDSRGRVVTTAECAAIFGVAQTTITGWVNQGCPRLTKSTNRGQAAHFDTADVADWLRKREVQKLNSSRDTAPTDELRRRKLAAEAHLAEMEAELIRGELIETEIVGRAIDNLFVEVRQKLRIVPQRVAPLLVAETDATTIKELLIAEVDEALTSLSRARVETIIQAGDEDAGQSEPAETAA